MCRLDMSMNKSLLRRKTLRLNHPNPLFEKWLQEWRDEAASRNSDTQYAFAKALLSLKKYPLPLHTGQECLILENFGSRMCFLIDQKLADYKQDTAVKLGSSHGLEVVDQQVERSEPSEVKKSKKKLRKTINVSQLEKKDVSVYIPKFKSSSYAILVALHGHLKKEGYPGEMTKSELQKAAQPLCDTSMYRPLPGSYYSGWSSVGQLIRRLLVQRCGNPHRYKLTQEGICLAEKLPLVDLESTTDNKNRNQQTFCSERIELVPEILNKNISSHKDDLNTEFTQSFCISGDNALSNKVCSVENSTGTVINQNEEIFPQRSFQIVLLVDTQEIHRGDELVKALEAQGILLEVRKLKLGDFAWVGRNAVGQELLLPFIIERKRLDDLASSIKDGRFHEQKFRMKQSGIPHCIYLVESHGQRQYSLPLSTLLQASANTQFIERFTVKYTNSFHETICYLAALSRVITKKMSNKTLIGCRKSMLPTFSFQEDIISLMSFKEFNKYSGKTRKYSVKEMFVKQLVQIRGLSVEKALAVVQLYPSPSRLMTAFKYEDNKLLSGISVGSSNRKIGPVLSKIVFELYSKSVLS